MTGDDLVWYAAYGSNLNRARFLTYLEGGRPSGSAFAEHGAPDPTPPRDERTAALAHGLIFAGVSHRWKGATAHLTVEPEPDTQTLARLYLVTRPQFEAVLAQEGRDYQAVTCHEPIDGCEVVAVTVPDPGEPGEPSSAYVEVMVQGLIEGFDLDADTARRYVDDAVRSSSGRSSSS